MQNFYAVIMAGGIGSRFWPESTEENPKQFLDLTGKGKSLLRQTFERINRLIPTDNILILTNQKYTDKIKKEIPEIPVRNILNEPAMRNTAPAIAYATAKILLKNPRAVTTVLPSDHYIADEEKFIQNIEEALHYAMTNNELITLGIQPESPHTGYGYIEFDRNDTNKFKKVLRFVEKPVREKAQKYLQSGNFLWNAGIFIWSAHAIGQAFENFLPGMWEKINQIPFGTEKEKTILEKIFPRLENISIDYGVMEKADNVRVLPVSFGWNDLGSWDSLYKQLTSEKDENIGLNSQLFTEQAHGNLVKTQNKKVILSGLKDYMIIETDDVLMIIPRSQSQQVKNWREKIKKSEN